ncbi:polyprenyl synthetase family protein [Streptomyces thermolilacinus]|uniref:Geranylgeranyl pyrophosphate synthase n=1 Tax=Streptomyces thermolilacinus SPC6 TaxID=1306406 RepID=A0A1D3DMD3_9ACTN|nr:polyprenyl synthetase family protein [Streptomyces thermolilacinus]OEJ93492.1 geranylgeranyl pyrophosphate synthase [Streptomyces thermolilacinus SPC6]
MLGPWPTAAEPVRPAGRPLTARDVARAVETELRRVLDENLRRTRDTDRVFAREVAERVGALVLRGGKRLRTAFAWCGWRAAGGSGCAAPVLRTGAALELVQACALVHDDVMDGSPLRRGGPAVHVEFARLHKAARMVGPAEAFATSAAVLAGDLALAWADDLLTETALRSPHGPRLYREWQAMRGEMVAGQYRDIRAQATGASGVADAVVVATLKSALYTVERPLALGASLAGADAPVLDALRSAGRSAGLAFQLRDDLLGTFGDPALTGKPADEDLRTRKPTYLFAVGRGLAEACGDREAANLLAPRGPSVSDDDVQRTRAALERTGARAVVESKIAELAAASLRHFDRTGAEPSVRREFSALVERACGAGAGCAGEAA